MPPETRHDVVELRQYTLHAGRRDALITLFDREFVETQEACGITVLGQYRDEDDPDRFVWLRGFADMPARAAALACFYGGPAWQAHRDAANATMVDSDDVLLLRPALPAPSIETWQRGAEPPSGAALVLVLRLTEPASDGQAASLTDTLGAMAAEHGGRVAGCFVTEAAANNFPRLPVREGERVIAWPVRFAAAAPRDRLADALARDWHARTGLTPTQLLRLAPTTRSRF